MTRPNCGHCRHTIFGHATALDHAKFPMLCITDSRGRATCTDCGECSGRPV